MRFWPKRQGPDPGEPSAEAKAVRRGADESERAFLARLANAHLEAEIARRWLELVRPAIRLAAASGGDPVVARLGGRPRVPADFEWPVWDGHGPLSYIAEVDLTVLAQTQPGVVTHLPSEGRLLAFYFDGSYDNFEGIVGTWDKESLAGARIVQVLPGRTDCPERPAPEGVPEFQPQELTARPVMTFPNWEHPVLQGEFGKPGEDHREWMKHPVNAEEFTDALWELHDAPRHQIGGWADPVQGPVEYEVAQAALDEPFEYGGNVHTTEALLWTLLLQIDSDDASEMMWGDVGTLYWLIKPEQDTPDRLGTVSFTWQCG